jgi:hypothetical protein
MGVARILVVAMVACTGVLLPLVATADPPAREAFAKLKALRGEWQGTSNKGKKVHLSYEPIAGGTAILETFREEGSGLAMSTVYHLDGEHLMLTHYCVSNNQPRMRALLPAPEPSTLQFELFDITNQKDPNDGHMQRAVLHILDDTHLTNAWTFFEKGKESFTETGTYERVKAK